MKDIVLFGRGERAAAVNDAIEDAGHRVKCWHSVPDRARDWSAAVAGTSLGVVANWPLILSKETLAGPKYGFINCHGGPVPNYRGGSPLNWQIVNGEETLWVSLLRMDEGLDTGPVIASTGFRLFQNEAIGDAHDKANEAFALMVTAYLDLLENHPGSITETPQEFWAGNRPPRTWPQRNDDMGEIDLAWPAERIVNFVRALTHPYPGAWLRAPDGRRLRIWKATCDRT